MNRYKNSKLGIDFYTFAIDFGLKLSKFDWINTFMGKHGLIEAPELPRSTTRHILHVLAAYMSAHADSHCGPGALEFNCYPSTRSIAVNSGYSERAVVEHLKYAEDNGWIVKMIRGRSGKGWKRHEYVPAFPEGTVFKNGEVGKKRILRDGSLDAFKAEDLQEIDGHYDNLEGADIRSFGADSDADRAYPHAFGTDRRSADVSREEEYQPVTMGPSGPVTSLGKHSKPMRASDLSNYENILSFLNGD